MGTRANRNQAHGVRQRLRPLRDRAMARRPGFDGKFSLSPRERRILGWVVALVLVIGIALVVGLLGGDADGAPAAADGSASASAAAQVIAFGTAIDAGTGEVAVDARTDRFVSADAFAYSVRPAGPIPSTIYVEVERTGGGPVEVVQGPANDWDQVVAPDSVTIAFSVPAADLLEVFGPGEYRMRIFDDPAATAPIAEGGFILVADPVPASAPSGSP
jgi:hypothetical protein